MRSDLPTPDDILEELADKVTGHIERLAPVAFDEAFREMTRYHRFLLGLTASTTQEGAAFSFAEVAGNAWHPPHRDWIRQYRRLFERAADRLATDDHFIRWLAYAPSQLLPRPGDLPLPTKVVNAILDLGPMLVHRLEEWVTRRTTIEIAEGEAARPRLTLAGSDAKAYANVLPEVVGAWEGLLRDAAIHFGWNERGDENDAERWSRFAASWPFMWQHLSNTAHCLAAAVWNEDEAGAAMYRDALVRWPQLLRYTLEGHAEFRHRRLVFPDILKLSWVEASARVAALAHDYMPAPSADEVFATIIRGAHDDVVLLAAALMLFWAINDKQASDIGGRTARSLLRREQADKDENGAREQELSVKSLLLDLARLEMAGERWEDGSYSAELDALVASLDNMTERRVVPGRVFTPSTLHGREDLLLAIAAILAASTPDMGDDDAQERLAALAREEAVLPGGDRALRNILHEFDRVTSALEPPGPQLLSGIQLIAPDRDANHVRGQLRNIVRAAVADIQMQRQERLAARPVDVAKIERLRAAIETALLNEPPEVPFFKGVEVEATAQDAGEWREKSFAGIPKAQLVEPVMETPVSNFQEWLVSGSEAAAGDFAWHAFCGRMRTARNIGARIEDEDFWMEIAPLVADVGPDPVLVVSNTAEARTLRRLLFARAVERPPLAIERHDIGSRRGEYIATIEGVDVFGAAFPPGTAWLFSGRALRSLRYAKVDQSGHRVSVAFDPGEDLKGRLRVRMRQVLEWNEEPILELNAGHKVETKKGETT